MEKEKIKQFIEDDMRDMNKSDRFDIGYICGLIDMAYLTKSITRHERIELKRAVSGSKEQ